MSPRNKAIIVTLRFRLEIEELVSREYEQVQARWKGLAVIAPEQEQAARA